MVKYLIAAFLSLVLIGTTACQPKIGQTGTVTGGVIQVVAAENFWGSIATQLGGTHVNVISIVTDPNADPHEFETNTADALDFAHANYVILNGAGYDTWGQKLVAANPSNGRKLLNVADLLGKTVGDNPHFWYDPDDVQQVINQITSDFQLLDPADAVYFSAQQMALENALTPYRQLIQSIKQTYGGTEIGGTESIVVYLADAMGLDLISPPDFMNAVSEGNDPPTQSVAAFEQQINQRQISVLIYNNQTATAVTTNLEQLVTAQGIPVVGISETMEPPDTTFQDWQYAQLTALQRALSAGAVSK
jgi:zinc/manganese transport system substrate-binding protein